MALWFVLGVALLLPLSPAACDHIPDGLVQMACHDRYFMMAVNFSFGEEEPRFNAVDGMGVYPITKQYAARCGYSVLTVPGQVELRASYFSCHTDNKDQVFTFSFNLTVTHEGREVAYALNKTCSPSLPWSPREVTCEINYIEVSVSVGDTCPAMTQSADWNALSTARSSTPSDWQVMFYTAKVQLPPMNLSEACKQGYVFELTNGRLVFRTPYGQPDSFSTEVNGVPVEVVHATLFSRHSWVVFMVELVAACSMSEGSHDGGHVIWETPEALYPSLNSTQIKVGFGSELMELQIAEERGLAVSQHNATIQLHIPYNVEGGYRKIFVNSDLYEYYIFNLYFEQISVDENHLETRLRYRRVLHTPLLPHPLFINDRTVHGDWMFSVYLGDVPEDVELAALQLNGHEMTLSQSNASTITKVGYTNKTSGFILNVSFDDPIVLHQYSSADAVFQYKLDINYTLMVLPENEPFYYLTSVAALFSDVSPPTFHAICFESGISFKLNYQPFHYLWEISIGSDLLTPELAAHRGYIMSNDSKTLLLNVSLFTPGYTYKDITLNGFLGTFEILMRERKTLEVQGSTIKTCPFSPMEFIVCSTDGWMTVVADMSLTIPQGGIPALTNLIDTECGPKEADNTRALFSFPINACGSSIKLGKDNVTYQNEIFSKYPDVNKAAVTDRVLVQCMYPLAGLHRLFSVYRFESETAGVGSIIHKTQPTADLQSNTKPATAQEAQPAVTRVFKAPRATRRPLKALPARKALGEPVAFPPGHNPTAYYIRVSGLRPSWKELKDSPETWISRN
nr:uncharacterized protein LOC109951402 [Monopterus albus]